jgi:hypothetical protein
MDNAVVHIQTVDLIIAFASFSDCTTIIYLFYGLWQVERKQWVDGMIRHWQHGMNVHGMLKAFSYACARQSSRHTTSVPCV